MPQFIEDNQLIVPANYKRMSPTRPLGVPGGVIWGGYLQQNESSKELLSHDSRYRTYSNILTNTSIVGAGVRYFLNLIGGAEWSVKPADHRGGEAYAKRVEKMLFKDPETPWHRIVKRAAMFKFYGFAISEWILRRGEGGNFTLADVAPRPQSTIERWHRDKYGYLMGAIQTSPQTQDELYLPRAKIVYAVDDTLNSTPEGFGLFRHLVEPVRRLERYETLEGYAFETDLAGIPIGRIPYAALNHLVTTKVITKEQMKDQINQIRNFIKNHIRHPSLGMNLDSSPWRGTGENGSVSSLYQWDIQILKNTSTAYKENAAAIERLNREIAILLGVEQLLLGSSSAGSFALAKDKTNAFHLNITSTMTELADVLTKDLIRVIWKYNHWNEKLMPEIAHSGLDHKDFVEVADALQKIGMAGGTLVPGDPAIPEVRAMMGLPPPDAAAIQQAEEMLMPTEPEEDDDDIDELMGDMSKLYHLAANKYNEDADLEDDGIDHPVRYTKEELEWLAQLDREFAQAGIGTKT